MRSNSEWRSVHKEQEHVFDVRPNVRQPLFALDLLPTENHAWTRMVPVDGGGFAAVLLREQRCMALVA